MAARIEDDSNNDQQLYQGKAGLSCDVLSQFLCPALLEIIPLGLLPVVASTPRDNLLNSIKWEPVTKRSL